MSYLVLARKWRPQTFSDLVGQEHVSTTLGNAIRQGRVAHAFLFTGVRGVGKTTSARILAKALNCENGPSERPCLACNACREIAQGNDVDVQEIDGASHTGVDDVRRIQESLPYRPARDRFKILIVDEVHMLSGNAWNAFLKTLEEPPPHVKFIFATTEVHKVPITILSRCQRFDFKMIAAQTVAERVRYILQQEKIEADEAAIQLVAREAAGSMRDALSILDQAIAFSGERLLGDEVARALGVADRAALHELSSAVVEGRAADALLAIDRMAAGGFDVAHLARDLLRRFRELVIARTVPESETILDLADAELADVKGLAARADADDLVRLFSGMTRAIDDVARSGQPRHALEVALVRLARRPSLQPLDQLLSRLADLERRLGTSGGPGGSGGSGGAVGAGSGAARGTGGNRPTPSAPTTRASNTALAPATSAPAGLTSPSAHAVYAPSASTATASAAPAAAQPRPMASVAHAPSSASETDAVPGLELLQEAIAPAQDPQVLNEATVALVLTVAARLREQRQAWGSLLEHGVVLRCDSQVLDVAYERRSLMGAQVAERHISLAFAQAARAAGIANTRLRICERAPVGKSLAARATEQKGLAQSAARQAALDHPIVTQAIALFSAEVRSVRLPKEE